MHMKNLSIQLYMFILYNLQDTNIQIYSYA